MMYLSSNTSMDEKELYGSIELVGPGMQAFLVVLYSCTAAIALATNGVAVAVHIWGRRHCIWLFLLNLALADITTAIFSIPFTYTDFILGRWIFEPAFCPVVQFAQHAAVSVSIYTLTALSLDRYYAIVYPLKVRWTKQHRWLVIGLIWGVSVLLPSFQFVHSKAEKFEIGGHVIYDCNEVWGEVEGKVYTSAVFAVTFMIPFLVLSYAYGRIARKMWSRAIPGNVNAPRDMQQLAQKMKVVKMMAIVVALFALCWLPIQIFGLMMWFSPELVLPARDEDFPGYTAAFLCCHWLAMANSFANPIIYCFMSENFRTDLRELASCNRARGRLEPPSERRQQSLRRTELQNSKLKNLVLQQGIQRINSEIAP